MTIVSFHELHALRTQKIIEGSEASQVNASSIDVRLGNQFKTEVPPLWQNQDFTTLEVRDREALPVYTRDLPDHGFMRLEPGEFVLAHTKETFNLPLDISAEFRLKSSVARMGLSHALAVWCDPGWHGSSLTLELHNVSRYHALILRPGDKVGQMIFHRHEPVPRSESYAVKGSYNNDAGATTTKKERK